MDKFYGGTQSAQWWKISHVWLAEQNYFCRKDENVLGVWLYVSTQRLHIHNIMCAGHNYDNMEEIAIQLGWTSQG
jgi:hypothetical protein